MRAPVEKGPPEADVSRQVAASSATRAVDPHAQWGPVHKIARFLAQRFVKKRNPSQRHAEPQQLRPDKCHVLAHQFGVGSAHPSLVLLCVHEPRMWAVLWCAPWS